MFDQDVLPHPKVWPAIDGQVTGTPTTWTYREFVPDKVNFFRGPGAWGCYRSHLNLIEYLLNERIYTPTLILEDDAYPIEGFIESYKDFMSKVPNDWNQIYLGGQHLYEPVSRNPTTFTAIRINRSHAYMVRGEDYIKRLYQILSDWKSWPGQDYYADHAMAMLQLEGRWNIYTPVKWLVGQREGISTCTMNSVETRDWNA